MREQKGKNFYPAAGWVLTGLCLLLLLLPAMIGGYAEHSDKIAFAGFFLGAVLALVLAVLNIRFWHKKRWVLWIVNGLLLVFAMLPLLLFESLWIQENGTPADHRAVRELGLSDVSVRLEAQYDDHGGFHGDGVSMAVYVLDRAAAAIQMHKAPGWRKDALDENAAHLAYGNYLTDQDGRALVPQKEWDYWYFENRQIEAGADGQYSTDVLERPSFNFTLALYENSGRLYVFKMDT